MGAAAEVVAPLAADGVLGTHATAALGPGSVSSPPSSCKRSPQWRSVVPMRVPAAASALGATTPWTSAVRSATLCIRAFLRLAIRGAWAGPSTRPTRRMAALLLFLVVARWAEPARTPPCRWRPRCGRLEEVRRLAGPGLGNAAAVLTTALTAGRSRLRYAALLSTTVGGSGE